MRGRKPTPTAKRRLLAKSHKKPRVTHEPQLPPLTAPAAGRQELADVPAELWAFPRAIAEWRRVSALLFAARALTEADRTALIALCLEWSRYVDAISRVTERGMVIATKTGYPMPNPYIAIATKALSACTRLWPELGMTPSARTRVSAPPGDDSFAEFDTPLPIEPPARPH